MTRILMIVGILAILCPMASFASDSSLTPMQRLAALTTDSSTKTRMTPIPKEQFVCADRGSACGPGYPNDCCNGCYTPPGNSHGECQ